MIRVLLVDDERTVRDAIGAMLNAAPDLHVTATVPSVDQALDILESERVDVAILDLWLRGVDGICAAKLIAQRYPEVRLLALSSFSETYPPASFIAAGGLGYVSKGAQLQELHNAVRQVGQGRHYISRDLATQMAFARTDKAHTPRRDLLSPREHEVLALIAEGDTAESIARKLHVTRKTVAQYKRQIMEKLDARTDVQLVRKASQMGLCVSLWRHYGPQP